MSQPNTPTAAQVQAFFDTDTWTVTYVVWDAATRQAAVIDPVLDYNFKSGHTSTTSIDKVLAYVSAHELQVQWILETHAHADHLSGARVVQARVGGRIAIGEHIRQVQAVFKKLYNLERGFLPDGSQFDHLFRDGERYRIGALEAVAWHTPGHTPACMTHVVGDAAFVGDTLFMPDGGSARADFPGGDARTLYRSMRRALSLPPDTRLFMCHDYGPGGRGIRWESTVAEQRAANIHVRDGIDEDAYVALREARDATLPVPALILPSLQVNMKAGRLPEPESNGTRYFRLPIDAL
ncbi:MAG: MBL fold metallo-hydrolase [Lysobacteraceae bacterium]